MGRRTLAPPRMDLTSALLQNGSASPLVADDVLKESLVMQCCDSGDVAHAASQPNFLLLILKTLTRACLTGGDTARAEVVTIATAAAIRRQNKDVLSAAEAACAQAHEAARRHKGVPENVIKRFRDLTNANTGQNNSSDNASISIKLAELEKKQALHIAKCHDAEQAQEALSELKNKIGLQKAESFLKQLQRQRNVPSSPGAPFEAVCCERLTFSLANMQLANDISFILMSGARIKSSTRASLPHGVKSEFDICLLRVHSQSTDSLDERQIDVISIWEVKANPSDPLMDTSKLLRALMWLTGAQCSSDRTITDYCKREAGVCKTNGATIKDSQTFVAGTLDGKIEF